MTRFIRRTITVTIYESLTLVWSQPDQTAALRPDQSHDDNTVSVTWSVTKVSTHVNTFMPTDRLRAEVTSKPLRTAD